MKMTGAKYTVETKLTAEQYDRFREIGSRLGLSNYALMRETLIAALMLPGTPQAERAGAKIEGLHSGRAV